MRFSALLLVAFTALSSGLASAKPSERWVSLNQCVDRLLMSWTPERLAGVTYLSESPKPTHNGTLESVLALRPTRVIATVFSNSQLLARLRDYVPVTVLPQPQSWAEYQQWLQQLRDLGLSEQVTAHQRRTEETLAALTQQPQSVVMVMPNQWSWGQNTWANALLNKMNWNNHSASLGSGLVALQLEQLIQWQPDRVILEGFSERSFALANQWQQHPVMKRWLEQQRVVRIDGDTAACPVVNIITYLEHLGSNR